MARRWQGQRFEGFETDNANEWLAEFPPHDYRVRRPQISDFPETRMLVETNLVDLIFAGVTPHIPIDAVIQKVWVVDDDGKFRELLPHEYRLVTEGTNQRIERVTS